jgi:glycosyltransferase involved in cell wall biosynthesis
LLDSRAPTGAAVMALRRMQVLRDGYSSHALAMSARPRAVPRGSALRSVSPAAGLTGEIRLARADVVVTTSSRTLASAAPRLTAGRLVHFLHERPELALASAQFMRRVPAITRLVVPAATDPRWFATAAGLRADQVLAADDFVDPAETLLGSARGRVILAVGALAADTAILELAEGFRCALPQLPGWQLRVAGDGPGLGLLREYIAQHGLGTRLLALGPRYDLAAQYADAGIVARLERGDCGGLSVLEALAAGVPVLGGSAVPAVLRHVRSDTNGWVLDRSDPVAIAEALVRLADDERRARLAAGARATRTWAPDDAARRALHDLFAGVLSAVPSSRPSPIGANAAR